MIASRRSARQLQPATTTTNSTQDKNSSTENEKAIDVATNFLKALQTDNYDEAKKESDLVRNTQDWEFVRSHVPGSYFQRNSKFSLVETGRTVTFPGVKNNTIFSGNVTTELGKTEQFTITLQMVGQKWRVTEMTGTPFSP